MFCIGASLWAQQEPLQDLSGFESVQGNWQIAGAVAVDPSIDSNKKAIPFSKKELKKRKKQGLSLVPPSAISLTAGQGVLVQPSPEKAKLSTSWEHGNLDLEFDLLLAQGGQATLWLQGSYPIQLSDSWNTAVLNPQDMGGVPLTHGDYKGKAPNANAAKAPGLWQHVKLRFLTAVPETGDSKGSPARLEFLEINGQRVQEQLLLTGPSPKTQAPLTLEGHGVALKNLSYKLLNACTASWSALGYKTYKGKIDSFENMATMPVEFSGEADLIDVRAAQRNGNYGIYFKGALDIQEKDTYTFSAAFHGDTQTTINGIPMKPSGWGQQKLTLALDPGEYIVEIRNKKGYRNAPKFGLWVSGSSTLPKALHTAASVPLQPSRMGSPIFINVGQKPELVRAFYDYEGDSKQRLTHSMAVGDPSGIHYVYDLKQGNLACVWKGDFLNASPMWDGRGNGTYRLRGARQHIYNAPTVSGDEVDLTPKGYSVDAKSGLPTFEYSLGNTQISDRIKPNGNGGLQRIISGNGVGNGLTVQLAQGQQIEKLNDRYRVDGGYYIIPKTACSVQEKDGKQILVSSLHDQPIKYDIQW
ncbi:hypothetical protein B7P33_03440 [Sediminicola luteus]|uniref:3-keto-alpha-glucoside-1,2-lyase/3-keto-2-hydroxy-glucal hydratase domain-containing protein n=2 Tax=Sediminicola luteus TaxID=319238 RepID=A0A2A4GED3_9FLAO|nr:hypothetical protein B7P33_03440 [Sediminicola luteus]